MNPTTPIADHILSSDLFELLGLDALTELERYAYLSDVSDVVFDGAMQRFLTGLPEEKLTEIEQQLNQEPEEVFAYLQANHPEFGKALEEEIIDFRKDALSLFEKEG